MLILCFYLFFFYFFFLCLFLFILYSLVFRGCCVGGGGGGKVGFCQCFCWILIFIFNLSRYGIFINKNVVLIFMVGIDKIRKRDGSIADFDLEKIEHALVKAFVAVESVDEDEVSKLAIIVTEVLNTKFHKNSIPAVEEIQDLVEQVLIEQGYAKTAKAYILYRQKRAELRSTKKAILGFVDDSKLTFNGAFIAKEKYLLKDESGNIEESPLQMFQRVAKSVAVAELKYSKSKIKLKEVEDKFYNILSSLKFMPAGRTLANAGTKIGQLSNAFVIPIYDSVEDIFKALSEQAIIHKYGGGTGFDFSQLRAKGTRVSNMGQVAAGPVSYLKLFDQASSRIKTSSRQSSNMGILRVDHPDILEFITSKSREGVLKTFNISVGLTTEFMRAVNGDREYDLINPKTGKSVRRISARQVFDLLITTAWQSAEPGILFLDRINRLNPTSHVGKISAVSACAETPLHPYESSNLGSINLDKLVIGPVTNAGVHQHVPIPVNYENRP